MGIWISRILNHIWPLNNKIFSEYYIKAHSVFYWVLFLVNYWTRLSVRKDTAQYDIMTSGKGGAECRPLN
ncbi:MAG: hypothetical protein PWP31_422 [Clostridia bacterium]|nr:hypothetical protein [Clostridia bacterium]